MEDTNWLKQGSEPLFPDLLWSRPENKRQAGKLLIIGGNLHGFAAPVAAYNAAIRAGAGTARVMLPDVLKKSVGTSFAEAEFVPSTPSGSLAKRSLEQILDNASWADGVLIAGDLGRNSETAVLLSTFLSKYDGHVAVSHDSLDYFLGGNSPLLQRPKTLSVINMGKLQKLGKNNRPNPSIRHAMSLHELVKLLGGWSENFITRHDDSFVVSSGGQVSTTRSDKETNWQIELAAYAAAWWLQNRSKTFETLTTAVYSYSS